MADKLALSQYCKAQATLNKLDKETDEERKTLNERIRTYRSLLHEQLMSQNLSCIEICQDDAKDPVYVRLKPQNTSEPITSNLVMDVFRSMDHEKLHAMADKNGHDLPKMLACFLSSAIKTSHTKKTDKCSLSISSTKERGFKPSVVSNDTRQIATDLIKAKDELDSLKQRNSSTKKHIIEEQKEVEESVRDSLKKVDPVNMTTRVHMMQDGNEWVYYLRCKEKEVTQTIGIRRMLPIVENILVKTLEANGLGREYSTTSTLNKEFWVSFEKTLRKELDATLANTKKISKISLDRGAPRRSKMSTT